LFLATAGLSFIGTFPVSIKLPIHSNVYPDTFAIYWQLEGPYRHAQVPVKFVLKSLYGGAPYGEEETYDSMFTIPFFPEYKDEEAFLIEGTADIKAKPVTRFYLERTLKIIPKKEEVEALIALNATAPNIFNLRLLADAYEKEGCFANAYYIYKRMMIINEREGGTLWQKFYNRNYSQFNPNTGVER
jgi:hypothetical protein